jgi:hypothetical protein
VSEVVRALWEAVGGAGDVLGALGVEGPEVVLPSVFDVTGFAASAVGVARLAVAELQAARLGTEVEPVVVDTAAACAQFRSEALLQPIGWELPPVWDPVAGDYEGADGWIRLHTNARHHRDAALRVLGVGVDRDAVTAAVRRWAVEALEDAVVAEGGCAAAMRTGEAWAEHPQGAAVTAEPLVAWHAPADAGHSLWGALRVVDLTRVIAGPVCTRFLAAHGAEVTRVDPPGYEEVPALVPDTMAGKRLVELDLRTTDGRSALLELVANAHVVVSGYRAGALPTLGLDVDDLRAVNPSIVVAQLDAYGWTGPWAGRRGFDSLVQMSCGIAAAPGQHVPRPLPCQALDHGTGYLLAASVCRALTTLVRGGPTTAARLSLARTAEALKSWPTPAALDAEPVAPPADAFEEADTPWGPVRRVRWG